MTLITKGTLGTVLVALALTLASTATLAREQFKVDDPVAKSWSSGNKAPAVQPMSSDDVFACTVAMCMANPDGPTAVQECVEPIRKMHERLRKGKAMPHCKFLGGNSNNGGGNGGGGRDTDTRQQQR